MDLLSKLPLECLQHILQHLADDTTALSSLIALLSTNKYIASITLPYIYADINNLVGGYSVSSITTKMRYSLVRMLLRWMFLHGKDGLSEMLMLFFGFDHDAVCNRNSNNNNTSVGTCNTANTKINHKNDNNSAVERPKSPFDYLAHIRHLNLDIMRVDPSPQRVDSLEAHFTAYDDIFMSQPKIRRIYEGNIIYWEATWSIANPILQQLESLTIPLADIKRYMDAISRLGKLEHVRFNLDETFRDLYKAADDPRYVASNHAIKSTQAIVPFIKKHQRLFNGQLKSVSVCDVGRWHMTSALCPREILWQVAQASPPLHRPRHLAPVNWLQLAGHPLSTDLSHVVSLTSKRHAAEWLDSLVSVQEILARCRSLKKLSVLSLGKDGFKWAVQEKKAMLDRLCRHDEGGQLLLQESAASSHFTSHQGTLELIPLSSIYIEELSASEEIDDLAFAFSQTLESLTVRKYLNMDLFHPTHPIGQGWVHLPVLTKLIIRGYWNRLEIDRNLLSHFPNLVCLELADYTTDYNCNNIASCFVASLTSLEELELVGWSALTFHPETLSSTKRIKTLRMLTESVGDGSHFIPPLEELNRSFGDMVLETSASSDEVGTTAISGTLTIGTSITAGSLVNFRPRWSWDWQLPYLETLELTSEFAFRFQFRMLQGCPSLRSLSLNIFAYDDNYPRALTTADLFTTTLGTSSEARTRPLAELGMCRDRIVSGVMNLKLTGEWIIEDSMLGPFLLGMFPELRKFTGRSGVRGYTLASMMDVVRTGGHKWKTLIPNLPRPVHDHEMKELGLYCVTEVPLGAEVMDVDIFLSACVGMMRVVKDI
ncbi:hypothetical protein EC991_006215 [Linnemannia zychae]|nr:hypothetical protein EC991_006215 [Linnemannia zychae]